MTDLLILGFSFGIGGTLWCLLLAYFASAWAAMLGQNKGAKAWFGKLSGIVYIALGLNVLRVQA